MHWVSGVPNHLGQPIHMRFKFERCPTCETRSIIVLVDFRICPSVVKLLGRLFMWLTSSSTLFMNSLMLSPDPGMREKAIFILAARTTPLSVSSKMMSSKWSSAWMDAITNIGSITHHFRVSLQLFLHTFLRELLSWEYWRAGIHDRVRFSHLMTARTSWF